ncbi:TIGR04282 family arsenosugar biosynthesis glycosyltransferase [Maribacter sp. 2-571]|uniref:TIGR04282 family arsenosugar biosynthesis glycosyltransferase n=1 Tax=Maribacter sp. 2-571 TaxID=3417569 RepID=UPI003D339583
MTATRNALIIFTRNPELGKGKRRLAATVGDHVALEIYTFLLRHTVDITKNLDVEKQVYYSEKIGANDLWDNVTFSKKVQSGATLGDRMSKAFADGFAAGYDKICIIGSDMFDMGQHDLEKAFRGLETHDFVIGPATDGGYYLLGMKKHTPTLFQNKSWGEQTVLKDTLSDLKNEKVHLLPEKNDVDTYEDIKDHPAFDTFLKNVKND